MADVFYYNNQFVGAGETPVPIEERGHQFGDGVYEVVRVYGGRPFLLDWHLDRFERSLAAIGIENPYPRSEWIALIGEAIRRSEFSEATVYWHVTRGIAVRNHTFPDAPAVVSLTVHQASPKTPPTAGATVLALPDDRWANAYIKSINLLPNVVAKENAKRNGAVEALYIRNGQVTEGAGSNAFFVKDGTIYTAPADRYILGGITRKFVLHLADNLGIPVVEQALRIDELPTVDEVFMTSTTQEITAIQEVIAFESLISELHHMSDAQPGRHLYECQSVKTLWRGSNLDAGVAQRLHGAYKAFVADFANHGTVRLDAASQK